MEYQDLVKLSIAGHYESYQERPRFAYNDNRRLVAHCDQLSSFLSPLARS
jgi:hypothetical protein